MKTPTLFSALALACALAPTHRATADTLFFSNYNNHFLNPTQGYLPLSATSQRFAPEFFTLRTAVTLRGAALLFGNSDSVEHDLEAWLYAADGPNSGPGTLPSRMTRPRSRSMCRRAAVRASSRSRARSRIPARSSKRSWPTARAGREIRACSRSRAVR